MTICAALGTVHQQTQANDNELHLIGILASQYLITIALQSNILTEHGQFHPIFLQFPWLTMAQNDHRVAPLPRDASPLAVVHTGQDAFPQPSGVDHLRACAKKSWLKHE